MSVWWRLRMCRQPHENRGTAVVAQRTRPTISSSGFDVLIDLGKSDFGQSREETTRAHSPPSRTPTSALSALELAAFSVVVCQSISTSIRSKRAAHAGTALKINAFPAPLDLSDELAGCAREHGNVVAICTHARPAPHLDYIRCGAAVGATSPDAAPQRRTTIGDGTSVPTGRPQTAERSKR